MRRSYISRGSHRLRARARAQVRPLHHLRAHKRVRDHLTLRLKSAWCESCRGRSKMLRGSSGSIKLWQPSRGTLIRLSPGNRHQNTLTLRYGLRRLHMRWALNCWKKRSGLRSKREDRLEKRMSSELCVRYTRRRTIFWAWGTTLNMLSCEKSDEKKNRNSATDVKMQPVYHWRKPGKHPKPDARLKRRGCRLTRVRHFLDTQHLLLLRNEQSYLEKRLLIYREWNCKVIFHRIRRNQYQIQIQRLRIIRNARRRPKP